MNVLLITTDQQRHDSLGFTGNPIVQTPHLDRLAAQSVSFTRAFTPCPLCCPARQTLLSGVMPAVHGGHWNYGITSKVPALEPGQFVTWPSVMQEAGYRNDYLGKWHVHPDYDATSYGYRSYEREGNVPPEVIAPYYDLDRARFRGTPMELFSVGDVDSRPLDATPTHAQAGRAIRLLQSYADNEPGRPWHLRVDFPEPHLPCIPHEQFASMYDPNQIPPWPNFSDDLSSKPAIQRHQLDNWGIADWGWEQWSVYMAGYYAVVSQYDDAVGRILGALESLGFNDNTMVIYTTDHGDAAGSHRMMDKHYVMYEEEVHVPFLVRMPTGATPSGTKSTAAKSGASAAGSTAAKSGASVAGSTAAKSGAAVAGSTAAQSGASGATSNAWVSHYLDLGPTILEAVGLAVPAHMQGVSLMPEIEVARAVAAGRVSPRGETPGEQTLPAGVQPQAGRAASERTQIWSEYNGQQFGLFTQRMIRDERYKFVWNPTDIDELYDLETDPYELTNLAAVAESGTGQGRQSAVKPAAGVSPSQAAELLSTYRRRLYDQFAELGDPMVTGLWMRYRLTAE